MLRESVDSDLTADGLQSERTAVVLISHTLHQDVRARFLKLKHELRSHEDAYFVYDATDTTTEELSQARELIGDSLRAVTAPEILDVDYPSPGVEPEQETLVPGNLDLLYIHVSQIEPDYSRYWFIEYDVVYTGAWSELFDAFDRSNADVVGTTLVPYNRISNWYWWDTFNPAPDLEPSAWLRGFFPIIRLSREALDFLDDGYRAGWSGHFEAVVPTLAHHRGLKIEDIGGDGPFVRTENYNRFYTNTPGRDTLFPGTFVYRPVRARPGFRSGKLYHPVKPGQESLSSYKQMQMLKHWMEITVINWSRHVRS
jgi:hypothetical protein